MWCHTDIIVSLSCAGGGSEESVHQHLLQPQICKLTVTHCLSLASTTGIFSLDQAEMRDDLVQSIPAKLKQLSDFLGDKKWFTGDEVRGNQFCIPLLYFIFSFFVFCVHPLHQITYVDLYAYEVFDVLRIFESSLFDGCPALIVSYAQNNTWHT